MVLSELMRQDIPVVQLNTKGSIFTSDWNNKNHTVSTPSIDSQINSTVIDKETLKFIEVYELILAINRTKTLSGIATLYRSLINPSTSLDLILAKQDAMKELEADDKLRNSVVDYLAEVSKDENSLIRLLNCEFSRFNLYKTLKNSRNAGSKIVKAAKSIYRPKSEYLKILLDDINDFKNSNVHEMMNGTIYRTFTGIKGKSELKWYNPRLPFTGRIGFSAYVPSIVMAGSFIFKQKLHGLGVSDATMIMLITMPVYIGGFYGFMGKPSFDSDIVGHGLRNRAVKDDRFNLAFDSIGKLDEIMSFIDYARSIPYPTTIPTITDEAQHSFEADDLRNPILVEKLPDFIPNDVYLNGKRLTIITGPNSAGKSTLCKTITQTQLLAQIGSRVVARNARINIADKIEYTAPKFDSLEDEEGRYGTELERTKTFFFRATPKSIDIFDELGEGTTFEEKTEESYAQLTDFNTIGNTTLLITHNHELAQKFHDEGTAQCLMGEFNGQDPTHKFISGISKVSHANRIAEKKGFSKEDRQKYLIEKGYLK